MQISLIQAAFGAPVPSAQTAPSEGAFWLALAGVTGDLALPPEPPPVPPPGASIALGAEATPAWPNAEGDAPDPLPLLPFPAAKDDAALVAARDEGDALSIEQDSVDQPPIVAVAALLGFVPVPPIASVDLVVDFDPPSDLRPIVATGHRPAITDAASVVSEPFALANPVDPVDEVPMPAAASQGAAVRHALPVDARLESALRPTQVDLQAADPVLDETTSHFVPEARSTVAGRATSEPLALLSTAKVAPLVPVEASSTESASSGKGDPGQRATQEARSEEIGSPAASQRTSSESSPQDPNRSSDRPADQPKVNSVHPILSPEPASGIDWSSIAEPTVAEPKPEISTARTESVVLGESRPPARSLVEPPAPVRPEPLTDKIIAAIDAVAELRAPSRIRVQLEPEDLGTITVVVKAFGSRFDADIVASHDAVRQALEQGRAGLAQAVEARGMQLGQLTLTGGDAGPGHGQSGQSPDQQQASQDFQRTVATHQALAATNSEHTTRAALAAVAPSGAIDYTI
jgi:flagellar hook-length control protein FliK